MRRSGKESLIRNCSSGFVLAFRAMELAEQVTDDDGRAFIRVQITDMNN